VPQPWPPVAGIQRFEAEQVPNGALHPGGGGEESREVGKGRRVGVHGELGRAEPFGERVGREHRERAVAVAVIGAPERHQAAGRFAHGARRVGPSVGAGDARVRRRKLAGKPANVREAVEGLHRQPSSFAAWWYQAAR
jgi:hypothetical protein